MSSEVKTYRLSDDELAELHRTNPPKHKPYHVKDWRWHKPKDEKAQNHKSN
ncbi:hypothetical protein [Alkalibacillus almallahensis]|uniref:hypothetical protein n=1 Tax=Alkalibacillus almallahensis TaxID=1379154 RepID=UPI001421A362|nr:hypothetical protein [Alkalibacillus almallahensis]NIK10889.1 hypothetical protein [Alkalibacillus almallahensis]